jgi:hypothetical protein
MTSRDRRGTLALVLRVAAIVLLALVLLGRPWPAERGATTVYVLVDQSASVAAKAVAVALRELTDEIAEAHEDVAVRVVGFAGSAGAQSTQSTDIEAAVLRAVRDRTADSRAAIVIVSDGYATEGDTHGSLRAASEASVPVLWRSVPPDARAPHIIEVRAPTVARPGQDIPVSVRLVGTADRPNVMALSSRGGLAEPATVPVAQGQLVSASLHVRASGPGTLLLDAELRDAGSGVLLDRWRDAAAIDIEAPADILYVGDGARPLATSLRSGGWRVELIAPAALDRAAPGFARHAAVVLDDVPASVARPTTWAALGAAVRDEGTGLLVLGGPRSFAAGAYRDSPLEPLLPVASRPSGLGDSAAIAFVVDKSGSMGATSAGVDRFRLAQRAVIETAATLGVRDSAALVVFDAASRELLPLQGAAAFRTAVARPWAAQPRGGTQLSPALEAALRQLEPAEARRRILVLVTDGFVDATPDDALASRLAAARIELIALAVGPDADTAALQRLFPADRGTILRVGEAAELPAVMRQGLEARRAPIERGRIEVRERLPLPVLPAVSNGWPTIAAYDVTTAAPDAVVHLESGRGDPILAQRQIGLGRVVAVTSGLGAWTPDWLRWSRWPELAGGLVEWVSAQEGDAGLAVRVEDRPDALRVDVDLASGARWSDVTTGQLRADLPSGRTIDVPLAASAPGRLSAVIAEPENGLYSLTVRASGVAQRVVHLRKPPREFAGAEPNPDIAGWLSEGLLREWSPAALREAVAELRPVERRPERALLLAFGLFMLGLLVERMREK